MSVTLSFQGDYTTSNVTSSLITIPGHIYNTGDIVRVSSLSSGDIGNVSISQNSYYYVIRYDRNSIKLANSITNARNSSPITHGNGAISSIAFEHIALNDYLQVVSTGDVDVANNSINVSITTNGYETGDRVLFLGSISGLTNGSSYYVINNVTYIKLANTYYDAINNTEANITATGTGVIAPDFVPHVKVQNGGAIVSEVAATSPTTESLEDIVIRLDSISDSLNILQSVVETVNYSDTDGYDSNVTSSFSAGPHIRNITTSWRPDVSDVDYSDRRIARAIMMYNLITSNAFSSVRSEILNPRRFNE